MFDCTYECLYEVSSSVWDVTHCKSVKSVDEGEGEPEGTGKHVFISVFLQKELNKKTFLHLSIFFFSNRLTSPGHHLYPLDWALVHVLSHGKSKAWAHLRGKHGPVKTEMKCDETRQIWIIMLFSQTWISPILSPSSCACFYFYKLKVIAFQFHTHYVSNLLRRFWEVFYTV